MKFYPEGKGGSGGGGAGGEKDKDKDPGDSKSKKKEGQTQDDPEDDDEEEEEDDSTGEGKVEDLPPWAQKLVKGLRKENADHRTKNKSLDQRLTKFETGMKTLFGGDGQKLSPEEQVEQLTQHAQHQEMQNAVLSLALENGIPKDKVDYLAFKIQNAVASLKDDQELPEEELEKIVNEVKGLGGSKSGKGASSSVEGDDDLNKKQGKSSGVTLDEFVKMGIVAKSELYRKDKATYDKLWQEASSKGLIK